MRSYLTNLQSRYYRILAKEKTIKQCSSLGGDHNSYGWSAQLDPAWSEQQRKAYREGYNAEN